MVRLAEKRNLKEVLKRCDYPFDKDWMPPKYLIALHDQLTCFEEDIEDLIICLQDIKLTHLPIIKYLMTLYKLDLREAQNVYWNYVNAPRSTPQTRFKLPE